MEQEKVLVKGNEAVAQAAIMAGCKHFFGYPITPQTEVSAYMSKALPKVGGCFLQAESEVAAINMVYGAASAGARVMTSSSSPGISLKAEGISYIAASDVPCVIVNIMRSGPGLGGIQPAQGDYFQATRGGGHGDYRILSFAPDSIQEMVDLTFEAFDLTDLYRMPAFIVGDGCLGQMMEPVCFAPKTIRELPAKDWACDGHKGKRPRNIVNSLLIEPAELEEVLKQRYAKYAEIEKTEQRSESLFVEDAELVTVAYGICARVVKTAVRAARAKGLKVGMVRPITLWPFPKDAMNAAAEQAKAFLAVEMSMGQMVEDVKLAIDCKKPVHFYGRQGGFMPTPAEVLAQIEQVMGGLK